MGPFSDRPQEGPVSVLARVRVLERRERLTPLAMLELLATERRELGRWMKLSVIMGDVGWDIMPSHETCREASNQGAFK